MNPFVLSFTLAKDNIEVHIATQQITSICLDSYSVMHGKCTMIQCGSVRYYVTNDLLVSVARWQAALQSIAAGPSKVDFPGAKSTWENF